MVKKHSFWRNLRLSTDNVFSMTSYLNKMSAKGLHIKSVGMFKNTFEKDSDKRYIYALCDTKNNIFYKEMKIWEHLFSYKGVEFYRKKLPDDALCIKKRKFKKSEQEKEWLNKKLSEGLLLFGKNKKEYIFKRDKDAEIAEYLIEENTGEQKENQYIFEKALDGFECVSPSVDGIKYYFVKKEGVEVLSRRGRKRKKRMSYKAKALCSLFAFLTIAAAWIYLIFKAVALKLWVMPCITVGGGITLFVFLVFLAFQSKARREKLSKQSDYNESIRNEKESVKIENESISDENQSDMQSETGESRKDNSSFEQGFSFKYEFPGLNFSSGNGAFSAQGFKTDRSFSSGNGASFEQSFPRGQGFSDGQNVPSGYESYARQTFSNRQGFPTGQNLSSEHISFSGQGVPLGHEPSVRQGGLNGQGFYSGQGFSSENGKLFEHSSPSESRSSSEYKSSSMKSDTGIFNPSIITERLDGEKRTLEMRQWQSGVEEMRQGRGVTENIPEDEWQYIDEYDDDSDISDNTDLRTPDARGDLNEALHNVFGGYSDDEDIQKGTQNRFAHFIIGALMVVISSALLCVSVIFCYNWFGLGIRNNYIYFILCVIVIASFPFVFYSGVSFLCEVFKRKKNK